MCLLNLKAYYYKNAVKTVHREYPHLMKQGKILKKQNQNHTTSQFRHRSYLQLKNNKNCARNTEIQ